MALKSIVDDLADVPEALHGEYKEQKIGDKTVFVLDVEGVDAHPVVVNLKTAHERQKQANKTLTTDLNAAKARLEGLPEEFNAEEYERLVAAAEGKDGPKPDEQVARVREQLERKHSTELGKKDDRIKVLEGVINRTLVDDGLNSALDAAGIDPKFKKAARAQLKETGLIKLVEEDGQFSAIVDTDMGPMPLDKYVADWASGDEGKVFVSPAKLDDAPGSRHNRGTENNPYAKDRWNKTEQGRLMQTDRNKAERLARAAGFKDLAAANAARLPLAS